MFPEDSLIPPPPVAVVLLRTFSISLAETLHKETSVSEIEETFLQFTNRNDIAILLINQNIAEEIRHILDAYDKAIPAILEIPSKEHPYDPSKDSILRRAKGLFSAEDFK